MPDILITKVGRNRIYLTSSSDKGRKWMLANLLCQLDTGAAYVAMDAEHKEDFIKELQKNDIEYIEQ